ncbi:hypothetical protein GHT09_007192 [Marmota monax]|uniref:Uncharacterized protein n=1 Tax=Marmota monax TaxID=9995 RepID=A0A834QNZ8_MARMO|nr:hypothetical protein GHT09_007192 [Marmota monax]
MSQLLEGDTVTITHSVGTTPGQQCSVHMVPPDQVTHHAAADESLPQEQSAEAGSFPRQGLIRFWLLDQRLLLHPLGPKPPCQCSGEGLGARGSSVSAGDPTTSADSGARGESVQHVTLLFSPWVLQEQTSTGLRGCQFRSPLKKHQNTSPSKDYAFHTLTELEKDLVKFVSKVRNLKVTMANGGNIKLQNSEMPADPHNNITIYEIWGEEESE